MRKKPSTSKKKTLELIGYIDGFPCYQDRSSGGKTPKRGGFQSERIQKDPAMANVRYNYTEMGRVAKDVKAFKQLLQPMLRQFRDSKLHQRLISLFSKLKTLDTTTERGMRRAGNGMLTKEATALLRRYTFTTGKSLSMLLKHDVQFTDLNTFEIPNCEARYFTLPNSVTHLQLQAGVLHLNPKSMEGVLCISEVVLLPKTHKGTVTIGIPQPSQAYPLALPIVFAKGQSIVNGSTLDTGGEVMEICL